MDEPGRYPSAATAGIIYQIIIMHIIAIDPEQKQSINGEFDSLDALWRAHPAADIDTVDGVGYVSYCETCVKPILEGEMYYSWDGIDGVDTCLACGGSGPDHKPTKADDHSETEEWLAEMDSEDLINER